MVTEQTYFVIKVIAAAIGYFLLYYLITLAIQRQPATLGVLVIYGSIFILYLFFHLGIMVGHIRGNGVKVTPSQFPEIYNIFIEQCQQLEISNIPDLYILQQGGLLNAFATRLFGSNYVVVYSDILDEAYQGNMDTVKFVIGHELGHIKRHHLTKKLLLFPAFFVPFLNSAYSRGCEYTCDNIGAALSPAGAKSGLLLLASGKKLWSKVNVQKITEQADREDGFWYWFSEKVASHPHLIKRVLRFNTLPAREAAIAPAAPVAKPVATDGDHSAYMPKT